MRTELKKRAKNALHKSYWKSVLVSALLFVSVSIAFNIMSSGFNGLSLLVGITEDGVDDEFVELFIIGAMALAVGFIFFILGFLLKVFLVNPLEVGCKKYWCKGLSDDKVSLTEMGAGFQCEYKNNVKTLCVRDIFIGLWGILGVSVYMAICMTIGILWIIPAMQESTMMARIPWVALFCVIIFVVGVVCLIPVCIKMMQYLFVPYILAERPNILRKQAFNMSKQMMTGELWNTVELFLSFIGWLVLSTCTYDIVYIFYVGPYMNYTLAAYYQTMKQKLGIEMEDPDQI